MSNAIAKIYTVKPECDMNPNMSPIGTFDLTSKELSNWLYRTTKEIGSGNLPSAYDYLKTLPDSVCKLIEHVEERMLSTSSSSVHAILKTEAYELVLRMTNAHAKERELFVMHCNSDVDNLQFSTFGLTADNSVWAMTVCEEY